MVARSPRVGFEAGGNDFGILLGGSAVQGKRVE